MQLYVGTLEHLITIFTVADAAAHFHKIGGAIPDGSANITPKNRVTPNGYIPDNEPNIYRSEIRGALESSRNLRNHDLNGIAHAALERAKNELNKAKQQLEQLNAKFSSK
ncbi:hypothetical protein Ddc_11122 [Ditylenchus destructor]|nr:hypothetical protein Ddc_11122 [Ditylenchus destructor]